MYPLNQLLPTPFHVLNERIIERLTIQQKRIALIAIAIFSCFLLYFLARHCCFKALVDDDDDNQRPAQKPVQKPVVTHQVALKLAEEELSLVGIEKDKYLHYLKVTGFFHDPKAYLERWKAYREGKAENAQEMKAKADEILSKAQEKDREYVQMILNTGILVDPTEYLSQWSIQRGGTEEFRVPEDRVRLFFEENLNS